MDQATRGNAHRRLVTVFGGTGFLGRRIVRQLLDHDLEVRAASRRPERTASMFEPNVAGLTSVRADVQNETEVIAALAGSYAVVNCVSLYVERGQDTFDALHVEAAARLSRLARAAGVDRLAHISGIGADPDFVFALHQRTRAWRTGRADGVSKRNPDPPGCYVRTR